MKYDLKYWEHRIRHGPPEQRVQKSANNSLQRLTQTQRANSQTSYTRIPTMYGNVYAQS